MDFLKELASKLTEPFGKLKDAVETKNLKEIFGAVSSLVKHAVYVVEQISNTLKEAETILSGAEKHQMAMSYVVDVAVNQINEKVNIPFISEKQEAAIFRGIINALIHRAVRRFNKNGWTLE
jgi:hypothetical protein